MNSELIREKARHVEELKKARREVDEAKQQCDFDLRVLERQEQQKILDCQNRNTLELKKIERNMDKTKADIDVKCREVESQREVQAQTQAEERETQLHQLKQWKIEEESKRARLQADFDVLKQSFKDPVLQKLKSMEVIGELYSSMSFGTTNIN